MNEQIKFITAYGKKKNYHTPEGSPIAPIYEVVVNKFGQKVPEITGEKNIQEEIDAWRDDCLLENLLVKMQNGDETVLNAQGQYVDTTVMPNNLIEAKHQIDALYNTWDGLHESVKSKFDYDIENFVMQSGSAEWFNALQPETKLEEVKKPTESEVKTNES